MDHQLRSTWLFLTRRLCIVIVLCCWLPLFTGFLFAEELSGEPPGKVQKPAGKGSKEQLPPAKPAESPRAKEQEDRPTKKGEAPAQGSSAKEPSKPLRTSLILTVKLALMATPQLFPYAIEVEQSDHQVTLTGKVASEDEKVAAAEVAQSVEGVTSVHNKLEVVPELKHALAHKRDEVITQYVKERFAKSTTLKSANFDVRTENGIVTLSGVVRYQVIILEAAEAARLVPGVKAVRTDKIRVEE